MDYANRYGNQASTIQIHVPPPSVKAEQYQNYTAYQSQLENLPPVNAWQEHLTSSNAPTLSTSTSAQAIQFEARNAPPVDYPALLLALADEYFNAAYDLGSRTAPDPQNEELKVYHKLLATGLGCLEALLQVCSTPRFRSSHAQDSL